MRRHAKTARAGSTRNDESGVTLVELMVTVAVMAILLAIAAPAFNEVTLGTRLNTYANELVANVRLARSEAIKRNAQVTLCASSNGTSCGGDWEQGWIVLSGATVLKRQTALPSGLVVIPSGGVASLGFPSSGVGITMGVGITETTLKVCQDTPVGNQERVVTVRSTGGIASVATTRLGTCS